MFQQIREFINDYVSSSNNKITVDSDVIHNGKKLEYALSINSYMASLSVLTDLTYDFFVGEVESEKIKSSKTLYFDNIEDLLKQIKADLDDFSEPKQ
jgi:hypothetical protein